MRVEHFGFFFLLSACGDSGQARTRWSRWFPDSAPDVCCVHIPPFLSTVQRHRVLAICCVMEEVKMDNWSLSEKRWEPLPYLLGEYGACVYSHPLAFSIVNSFTPNDHCVCPPTYLFYRSYWYFEQLWCVPSSPCWVPPTLPREAPQPPLPPSSHSPPSAHQMQVTSRELLPPNCTM